MPHNRIEKVCTMLLNQSTLRIARSRARAAMCLAALFLFAGCERQPAVHIPVKPKVEQLVVVTPHNKAIRTAFGEAFSDWHHAEHGSYIQIDWVTAGTPQCVQYVREAGRPDFVPAGRPIPDVLFGGGPHDHQLIADQGLSRAVDLADVESDLPSEIAGTATRDPENRWHSSALSSFGILVAPKACRERGIAAPATWEDLADPRFFGWLAIADPERSGSNRQCLVIILQQYGWEQGWGFVMRIAANCRALAGSSTEVIGSVSTGNCLAGFCVNFSALRQIEQRGDDALAYVIPSDGTAITPDPLSVLTYALHPEIGKRFVSFCVSEAGQKTWAYRAEFRDGQHDTLFRYPINRTFYSEHMDKLGVPDNPFEMPSLVSVDRQSEKKQSDVIGPLLLAACEDNHITLQRCWRKIIDAGMHQKALAELLAPIVSESEAYELGVRYRSGGDAAEALRKDWSERFRKKLETVEAILAGS